MTILNAITVRTIAAAAMLAVGAAASSLAEQPPAPPADARSSAPATSADVVTKHEDGIVGRRSQPAAGAAAAQRPTRLGLGGPDAWTLLLLALGLVGAVLVLRQWRRGAGPRGASQAIQVLARTPLSGRQNLCLVRFGRTVLLLGVTPDHVRTLAEVRDPVEAAALVGAAESGRTGSLSGQFLEVLGSASQPFAASSEPTAGHEARAASGDEAQRRVRGVADRIRGFGRR